MDKKTFDQWAIVEIMGHQRLAGRVTEQAIGGTSFVRVDVPAGPQIQAFTKLLGASAIYAITVVDEETARLMSAQLRQAPLDEWSARRMLASLPAPKAPEFTDDSDVPFGSDDE